MYDTDLVQLWRRQCRPNVHCAGVTGAGPLFGLVRCAEDAEVVGVVRVVVEVLQVQGCPAAGASETSFVVDHVLYGARSFHGIHLGVAAYTFVFVSRLLVEFFLHGR